MVYYGQVANCPENQTRVTHSGLRDHNRVTVVGCLGWNNSTITWLSVISDEASSRNRLRCGRGWGEDVKCQSARRQPGQLWAGVTGLECRGSLHRNRALPSVPFLWWWMCCHVWYDDGCRQEDSSNQSSVGPISSLILSSLIGEWALSVGIYMRAPES